MNYENEESPQIREFKEQLTDKSQDWIAIYILAVTERMDYHASLIIESGNIRLNNNDNPYMLDEIITCIKCGDDNYLGSFFHDGYTPCEEHLLEIMKHYSTLKEGSYNLSIYNYFNQCARRNKLQKIKSKTLSGKTQQ